MRREAAICGFLFLLSAGGSGCLAGPGGAPGSADRADDHANHYEERALTATALGCPYTNVVVRDHRRGYLQSSWMAQCGEKVYRCLAGWRLHCTPTAEALADDVEHSAKAPPPAPKTR